MPPFTPYARPWRCLPHVPAGSLPLMPGQATPSGGRSRHPVRDGPCLPAAGRERPAPAGQNAAARDDSARGADARHVRYPVRMRAVRLLLT